MPLSLITIILTGILVIFLMSTVPPEETVSLEQPEYVNKIFKQDNITEINIAIKQEDWKWLIENATKEEYRSCVVTLNGTTYHNVGIRPKGNSSLSRVAQDDTTDRFSFKLSFDEFVDGQTCCGLKKLALNNMMSDPTYMKEYLSYDMCAFMNIATPAMAFSDIKINGKSWGLYLAIEVLEESFLERTYGSAEGNLYKPDSMDMGGGQPPNFQQGNKEGVPKPKPMEGIQMQRPNTMDEGSQRPLDMEHGQMPENLETTNQAATNLKAGQVQTNQEAVPTPPTTNGGKTGSALTAKAKNRQQRNFPGNSGKGGTNLVYTGDDLDNYSAIFNNTILKTTTKQDQKKVVEMIKNLNNSTNLENYLDVDEVLRYFAVNTFLVNIDSYAGNMKHNYYLYEENGIFQILPWDFNLSFGAMEMQSAEKVINFPIDKPVTDTLENSPLIAKLLEVPEYKELYHQYLAELVERYVNSGIYEDNINKIDALINSYVKNDATAFYSYEEYKASLPELLQFGKDRATSITAQLAGTQPSDNYGTLTTTVNMQTLGSIGGDGGQPTPANMPDWETMTKIREIMGDSFNGEFTAEQINQLKTLGLDEQTIEQFKKMPPGTKNGDFDNRNARAPYSYYAPLIGLSLVALIISLIFVQKYKRKNFKKPH